MPSKNPIIGIYKIISPSNRIYVGQSLDIHRRWTDYRKINNVKGQVLLYNSFLKYGVESHNFSIICVCSPEDLNDLEIYYGELYNCIDPSSGLNLKIGNAKGKNSVASNIKNSLSQKKRYSEGAINGMKGVKQSKELIKLRIDRRKGYKHSHETKLKIGKKHKGKKVKSYLWTKDQREKLSESKKASWKVKNNNKKEKATKFPKEINIKKGRKRELHSSWGKGKYVIQYDMDGNYINEFISCEQAIQSLGYIHGGSNIRKCCNKKIPTSYGYKWEYKL